MRRRSTWDCINRSFEEPIVLFAPKGVDRVENREEREEVYEEGGLECGDESVLMDLGFARAQLTSQTSQPFPVVGSPKTSSDLRAPKFAFALAMRKTTFRPTPIGIAHSFSNRSQPFMSSSSESQRRKSSGLRNAWMRSSSG